MADVLSVIADVLKQDKQQKREHNKVMKEVQKKLKEKDSEDKLFEDNMVRILVDKKSLLYLVGTTLDFSGGLNGKGFVFKNPNANRTCGCGESFSL